MRSVRQLFEDNRPSVKPELWSNVTHILRRRVSAWLNEQLDASWASRPFICTVGPKRLLLEVVPGDVVGKPIVHFGVYEYAVTSLLRAYLRPGDTFVDVGANLGYYSVVAADLVGPTGCVLAFEPSAPMRSRLERNVALNRLSQVEIRAEALGDAAELVRLIAPEGLGNDGLAYVSRDGEGGVEVPCIRLDSLTFATGAPAMLKVDVEGGEPQVFAGAERLLMSDDAPSIIFESFELARDAALLQRYGYQVFQPRLHAGSIALTADLTAPRYRRWEAPNFLAVKSPRGVSFAQAHLRD